jgi:hypothetical protein
LELGNIGEVEWKVGDEKSNMEVRKTLISFLSAGGGDHSISFIHDGSV